MPKLTDEIRAFLRITGMRQVALARASGVSIATINRIIKGKQKDTSDTKAQAIRSAMTLLTATPTTPPAGAPEGGGDE